MYGKKGKDSVIELVSTIRILTHILVWDSVEQEELSQQSEI